MSDTREGPVSFRPRPGVRAQLARAAAARNLAPGALLNELVEALPELSVEAEWMDDLDRQFTGMTIEVRPAPHGEGPTTAKIVGAEAKTSKPAPVPLDKLVGIEVRPQRGRIVVELVGRDEFAGARIFVCALPFGATVTLAVKFADLNPVTAAALGGQPR